MAVSLISAPSSRPITLQEVKSHLRIETRDEDTYLEGLIDASIAHLEAVCGLKVISQSWRQYLDCVPENNVVRLEVNPVISISAMRAYDPQGNANEISLSDLELDRFSNPARLQMNTAVSTQQMNGIEIDIVAGFGEAATDVPDSLKRALLLLVSHNFEFRGAVPNGQMPASEPHGFRALITPFIRVKL